MTSHREVVIFKRDDGLWDYHVVDTHNHEVVEGTLQGFTERNDCREAAEREHPDYIIRYAPEEE